MSSARRMKARNRSLKIERTWSLDDVMRCNALLDLQQAADRNALNKAEKK